MYKNGDRTMNKKGITPVVAILLLLMMVVAAAGGAYVWIQNFQEQTQEQATERAEESLNRGIELVEVQCVDSTSSVVATLRNSGNTELDLDPVDLRIRDSSTGDLVTSVTQMDLEAGTAGSGGTIESATGDFVDPGASAEYNITLSDGFGSTDMYRTIFIFADENDHEVEGTCEL